MDSLRIFNIDEKQKAFDILLTRNEGDIIDIEQKVAKIIFDVRKNGDSALFKYTKKFDGFDVSKETIEVKVAEINDAYQKVEPELIDIIKKSAENIKKFHLKQKEKHG